MLESSRRSSPVGLVGGQSAAVAIAKLTHTTLAPESTALLLGCGPDINQNRLGWNQIHLATTRMNNL